MEGSNERGEVPQLERGLNQRVVSKEPAESGSPAKRGTSMKVEKGRGQT